jgi:hypothetical protein
MSPNDEDFIRFYRDAVIAVSRDYIVRLLNETIARARRHRVEAEGLGLSLRPLARLAQK